MVLDKSEIKIISIAVTIVMSILLLAIYADNRTEITNTRYDEVYSMSKDTDSKDFHNFIESTLKDGLITYGEFGDIKDKYKEAITNSKIKNIADSVKTEAKG